MDKFSDAKSMLQYQQQQQQQQQSLLTKAGSSVGVDAEAAVVMDSSQESWLSLHMNNNNNAVKHMSAAAASGTDKVQDEQSMWQCVSCQIVGVVQEQQPQQQDNSKADAMRKSHMKLAKFVIQPNGVSATTSASAQSFETAADGAACSLTPPGSSPPHSNRTSINNSTENLSYSSDNYFADDIILIDDEDDVGENDVDEEISLNSDDCIYAYRGEGAEFDFALDVIANRNRLPGVAAGEVEDETDFLEMDFEPDPLSEIEYGNSLEKPLHMDALLLQRNTCHTSGGVGGGLVDMQHMSLQAKATQRPLFSSPINDLPAPKALQNTAQLSKDFARISLHLNEIKDVEQMASNDAVDAVSSSTAHSLPSALTGSFNMQTLNTLDANKGSNGSSSSNKVTGAKPKRFNTFSAASKNPAKTRTSLRATLTPALCSSSSFDERSISCAEFRSTQSVDECTPKLSMTSDNCNLDYFGNEDAICLDCIEKEFLAHTIGKSMDTSQCLKCRKRSTGNLALYARVEQSRCRSGTPTLFADASGLFEASAAGWSNKSASNLLGRNLSINTTTANDPKVDAANDRNQMLLQFSTSAQQIQLNDEMTKMCDNAQGEQHKHIMRTETQSVTIPTLNLSEDMLLQALDKLQVSYCAELIKYHFSAKEDVAAENSSFNLTSNSSSSTTITASVKQFENLKDLLLHESKKHCNHVKLKRLIQLATRKQLKVQFRKNTDITEMELVPVKVTDILQQWNKDKNLSSLEQLDKRFAQANVLGKVANLLRQTQQRSTQRRPQPEFISIPQYYASGFLTLSKNC